ncbi:hypothetical protein [Comamonas antarctica]|uniref:hypothetical protein n=1 Tax=Comamonas antarctica TaxID=2743470 RepID=UPI0028EFA884|nr:hypothetical protein [Comamonas antarctica]
MKNHFSSGKLKVTAIHATISLVVAILISIIVFNIWFPGQIANISHTAAIYWLIISVDVICGPILLMLVWNLKKTRKELIFDTTIIAAIQIAALAYGLWSIYQIRPVHIVFETDRLRLINASEIDPGDLTNAPERWKTMPLLGPELISTLTPNDGQEMLRSIDLSIAGKEPSVRPEMWEEYAPAKEKVRAASRTLAELLEVYPEKQTEINRLAKKFDVPYDAILWLPFTSARSMDWVALIDARNMEPFTYIPGDGFIPRR